jgi:large subunit ribosomal protein L22
LTDPRPYVGATAKHVKVTARKARLVADHVRGRSVPEARTILAFMPRAAARDIEKVLRSAVANAETNPHVRWSGDDLYVSAIYIDEATTLKRWQQRARGRVSQILKRTCHITIKLDQTPDSVRASKTGLAEGRPKRRRGSAPGNAGPAAGATPAKKSKKKKEVTA